MERAWLDTYEALPDPSSPPSFERNARILKGREDSSSRQEESSRP